MCVCVHKPIDCPPSFINGPSFKDLNLNTYDHLFFFNILGNGDPTKDTVNLLAMPRGKTKMAMLDEKKHCWNENFTNHQKLTFPINDFRFFGCDFMVKKYIFVF